jgi:hypothetical protein
MSITFFAAPKPNTPFAPNFNIAIYENQIINPELMGELTRYVGELERTIIKKEQLVSEVPVALQDPYPYTAQWKQHNLLDDTPRKGDTSNLVRFPKHRSTDNLFYSIRQHYLEYLRLLNVPRSKIWINAWVNILRNGQWITPHHHLQTQDGYLSGSVYVTSSNAKFIIEKEGTAMEFTTEAGKIMFFPSCLTHHSQVYEGNTTRISISFDLVVKDIMEVTKMRPYRLLDDPDTMPGLDTE